MAHLRPPACSGCEFQGNTEVPIARPEVQMPPGNVARMWGGATEPPHPNLTSPVEPQSSPPESGPSQSPSAVCKIAPYFKQTELLQMSTCRRHCGSDNVLSSPQARTGSVSIDINSDAKVKKRRSDCTPRAVCPRYIDWWRRRLLPERFTSTG